MTFVRIRDGVLHVARLGVPDKPGLIFSNSLGTDFRIWAEVLTPLLDHHNIVLYDKRGHGLSDGTARPASIEDHAADLIGLADHCGLARFGLIGLSVGGLIGQAVAARHPGRVAALVLCDTAARIGTIESWNSRIAAIEADGLASIADTILGRWFTADYRQRQPDALQGWCNMLVRQPAEGYVAICAAIRDADYTALAPTIRAPTLVVVGDQDLSTPPDLVRATAELIPQARFEIIAGSGHLPCIEQPAALVRAIRRHLQEAGHV